MATQSEVLNFIKSNYETEVLSGGDLKLVFDLGGGRSQLAFVDVNESNAQFSSPFATLDDVTAKQALEANSEYSVGMQMVGNWYVIKHVVPLADLDASEVSEAFELVANIADMLEKKLVGGDKL
jgi:hypothetical protein